MAGILGKLVARARIIVSQCGKKRATELIHRVAGERSGTSVAVALVKSLNAVNQLRLMISGAEGAAMGCGSSMETQGVGGHLALENGDGGQQNHNMVKEYVRLDERIGKLEGTCPGPRMATAEAWLEHLQAKREALLGLDGMEREQRRQQEQLESDKEERVTQLRPLVISKEIVANTPNKDLAQLAHNLGVIGDQRKASTHEDFFAQLSESALHLLSLRYYNELLEHTKARLQTLVDNYGVLNELYVSQDTIIAHMSGGTYMSRLEETIDAELETVRDQRDKLGSTIEQWRISGMLLRAAANTATGGLRQWRQLDKLQDPQYKLHVALNCRTLFHASLTSLECAQLALPHVELKHLSNRQVTALRHCNTYLITDIANPQRYEHTTKVITNYETNISKASTWLYDTFNKSLRRDFDKAEKTVNRLAKTLRDHREEIFTAARK